MARDPHANKPQTHTNSQHMAASWQAYLLWQQERGLSRPLLRPPAARPCTAAGEANEQSAPAPMETPVLREAGAEGAVLLCLCPSQAAEPRLIAGPARELLLKMLQAMGLNLQSDIYMVGLILGAEAQAYQTALQVLLPRLHNLRAIISLGTVATCLSLSEEPSFAQRVHRWQKGQAWGGSLPVMPLYHPADILAQADLKRDTWHALQQVMQVLQGSAPQPAQP